MKVQVFINPKAISVNDRAFNYGDGLFETILVKEGNPLFLDDHISRLYKGCKILQIPIPSKKLIKDSVIKSIGRSKNCLVKVLYSRGISEHGYNYNKNIEPNLYIIKKKNSSLNTKQFISLGFSKYKLWDNPCLSQIKHLNRLEQILAINSIKNKKYDSYILLNKRNNIIECISSNIFFYTVADTRYNFYTPNLCNSGVDGIIKKMIMRSMKRKKINIHEVPINKNDIKNYNGCFICNSVTGVQFVKKIVNISFEHSKELESILSDFIYE